MVGQSRHPNLPIGFSKNVTTGIQANLTSSSQLLKFACLSPSFVKSFNLNMKAHLLNQIKQAKMKNECNKKKNALCFSPLLNLQSRSPSIANHYLTSIDSRLSNQIKHPPKMNNVCIKEEYDTKLTRDLFYFNFFQTAPV